MFVFSLSRVCVYVSVGMSRRHRHGCYACRRRRS